MFLVINIFSGENSRSMCCDSNTAKRQLSVAMGREPIIVITGVQFSENLLNGFEPLPFCISLWRVDSK